MGVIQNKIDIENLKSSGGGGGSLSIKAEFLNFTENQYTLVSDNTVDIEVSFENVENVNNIFAVDLFGKPWPQGSWNNSAVAVIDSYIIDYESKTITCKFRSSWSEPYSFINCKLRILYV